MLQELFLVRFQYTEDTKSISVHTCTECYVGEVTKQLKQDRQCIINEIFRRVRAMIFAMLKQQVLNILIVCL